MQSTFMIDFETLQSVAKLLYAAALCYGCISDIRRLQIPNAVSLALLVLFFCHHWLLASKDSLAPHLLAAGLAFLLTFGLYLVGIMGAGDVKLISVLMLWGGVRDGPTFLVVMILIGGLCAGPLLIVRLAMQRWPTLQRHIPSRRVKNWARRGIFPYGIAICLAGLISIPPFFSLAR
jgi:prepilin peptidase CpaA